MFAMKNREKDRESRSCGFFFGPGCLMVNSPGLFVDMAHMFCNIFNKLLSALSRFIC